MKPKDNKKLSKKVTPKDEKSQILFSGNLKSPPSHTLSQAPSPSQEHKSGHGCARPDSLDLIRLSPAPLNANASLTLQPPKPMLPSSCFSPPNEKIPVFVDRKKQMMKLSDWLSLVRARIQSCGKYVVLTVARPYDSSSSLVLSTSSFNSPDSVLRVFSAGCGKRFVCSRCANRFFHKIYSEICDVALGYMDPLTGEISKGFILYVVLTSPKRYLSLIHI